MKLPSIYAGALALAITHWATWAEEQRSSYNLTQTKENIHQLVGNILTQTDHEILQWYATYDCKQIGSSKIYFSESSQQIPTDAFFVLGQHELDQIQQAPSCMDK